MKRLLIALFIFASLLSLPTPAAALGEPDVENSTISIQPFAEITEWKYRAVDGGRVQRRLWSVSYGYWLTEWEYV